MRAVAAALVCLIVVLGIILLRWRLKSARETTQPQTLAPQAAGLSAKAEEADSAPTRVYAHNLMLRKGPNFRIYVRWLRGEMTRTHANVVPSFDDSESFILNVKTGVIRANIGD